jgi:hypothetical protein
MSFRGTNKQHLIEYRYHVEHRSPSREAADSGLRGTGAGGEASGVGGTSRGVWRSRREESDRRRRRLWFRRRTFR